MFPWRVHSPSWSLLLRPLLSIVPTKGWHPGGTLGFNLQHRMFPQDGTMVERTRRPAVVPPERPRKGVYDMSWGGEARVGHGRWNNTKRTQGPPVSTSRLAPQTKGPTVRPVRTFGLTTCHPPRVHRAGGRWMADSMSLFYYPPSISRARPQVNPWWGGTGTRLILGDMDGEVQLQETHPRHPCLPESSSSAAR